MAEHMSKNEKQNRADFDERVRKFYEKGFPKEEIAIYMECSTRQITYAINRIELGKSFVPASRDAEAEAKKEAELLIEAKMAPIHKPKAKLIRVDGWEEGKYVHYTAYDVSEFWGLS